MSDLDYLVRVEKQASIDVFDPNTGQPAGNMIVAGAAGKGCRTIDRTGVYTPYLSDEGWFSAPAALESPIKYMSLEVFQGELLSQQISGLITMKKNPTMQSVGREISITPGSEYPKVQEFRQYSLFTFVAPEAIGGGILTIGNRRENPIQVRTQLNRPFGEEQPIVYELLVDNIPLWLWDTDNMAFYSTLPLNGQPAAPIAFLRRENDRTAVTATWRREVVDDASGEVDFIRM